MQSPKSAAQFQSFDATATPELGASRLANLRGAMAAAGVDGFIVPRADRFQGEYVAPCDARLAWLTGFTGSAGLAVALQEKAAIFIDGRYRVQVRHEVDVTQFDPIDWPATRPEDWIADHLPSGSVMGLDPWLHSIAETAKITARLEQAGIGIRFLDGNLIDRLWQDRPAPPKSPARAYPVALAGRTSRDKRRALSADLARAGQDGAVLTQPDSIAWLLNIRGGDLPHLPVVQAMAILWVTGDVTLFADPEKFADVALDTGVRLAPMGDLGRAIAQAKGKCLRLDPATAPEQIKRMMMAAGVTHEAGSDPCLLPKARKTAEELDATRAAHRRDGAAMVRFLHWFDEAAPKGELTEIDCVCALEYFRRETGALLDISFDTIAGAGAHGAIVHYRVNRATNAPLKAGQVFLIDSGGQYLDGTTDVTRTLPVTDAPDEARQAFTQVLRGMIAISRLRFPHGLSGRDIDALARAPLWMAGRDFDHGTGHGVGVYLSVHEGPQRISRMSSITLETGMILSNEPGYYREGAFGIRIENLIVVCEARPLGGGDAGREMVAFETLTLVPIDRRMIALDQLERAEIDWLDAYHARVLAEIAPLVPRDVAQWLAMACAPLRA